MEFKASDIAAFLGGELVGDGSVRISNVSKIEEGQPGTLAFLANPKYEAYLYTTKASVILINKNVELKSEVEPTLIKVDDAYQSFASLLELYVQARANAKKGIEQPSFISETAKIGEDIYLGAFAYIGNNVSIGDNVKIYPNAYVGDNTTISDNCILYSGVKIYEDCVIGKNCIIHAGAVIGADGFGFAPQNDGTYKKIPQIGNVILEDDVEIGANTCIDCATMGSTIIRQGTKLDDLIMVGHNCEIGKNTVFAAQVGVAGSSKVGDNCKFGGQVGIAGHAKIGNNVQLGGQAGVSGNIKDGKSLLGSPAIDIVLAAKSFVALKNLPGLVKDVHQLKKEIKDLKPE